jgi:hypothetical protein
VKKKTISRKLPAGKNEATKTLSRGTSPVVKSKKKFERPRTAKQFFALSADAQEQWIQVTSVIQKVRREGISVSQAARDFGIDRKKVIELGGSALRKQTNGRYKAKPFDRLLRVLKIPGGSNEVAAVRDSRTASKLAEYSNAVHQLVDTGDQSQLRKFKRLRLKDAQGKRIKLLTDVQELSRQGSAGVLSFESLYARLS